MIEGKFYPSKSEGTTTLYYRIRKSRNMDLKITLKNIRIKANAWNVKQQRFKPLFAKEYSDVSIKLTDFDLSVHKLSNSLQLNGDCLNLIILKNHYNEFFNLVSVKKISEATSFINYYDYYIERNSKIDTQFSNGKNLSYNSIKGYKSMIKIWKTFERGKNIHIGKIDFKIFTDFVKYQESEKKLGKGSIATNVNKFKAVLSYAYENDINVHQDYIRGKFKFSEPKTKEIYLTQDEIKRIINLSLTKNSTLDIVRDWFIIQCYTALRISDLFTLTLDNFENGFIHKQTIKTKEDVCIPIGPNVKNVIEKYNGLPFTIAKPTYNKLLKAICKMAEINSIVEGAKYQFVDKEKKIKRKVYGEYFKYELVCSHTARRSYITYLSNISILTKFEIMAITGHTSTRTLESYVKTSHEERAYSFKVKLDNNGIAY